MPNRNLSQDMKSAAAIVASAQGELVGRTRLQKTAYLLEISGVGYGFSFSYKHYGPFSQELADSAQNAVLFGELEEVQRETSWGGSYSIYRVADTPAAVDTAKEKIVMLAKDANPIELELAATAAFLADQGFDNPWDETAKRKPEKIGDGRLEKAQLLYARFTKISTPDPWPDI